MMRLMPAALSTAGRIKKSKREIYAALAEKGIARDEIDEAMEECYGHEDARHAIMTLLAKKHYDPETAESCAKPAKILGYLNEKKDSAMKTYVK